MPVQRSPPAEARGGHRGVAPGEQRVSRGVPHGEARLPLSGHEAMAGGTGDADRTVPGRKHPRRLHAVKGEGERNGGSGKERYALKKKNDKSCTYLSRRIYSLAYPLIIPYLSFSTHTKPPAFHALAFNAFAYVRVCFSLSLYISLSLSVCVFCRAA